MTYIIIALMIIFLITVFKPFFNMNTSDDNSHSSSSKGRNNSSSSSRSSWAYPDEIMPKDAYRKGLGSKSFEEELNARYSAAKSNHLAEVDRITIPANYEVIPLHAASLKPQEILFLWYLHTKRVTGLKLPIYWRLTYNISDYQALINRLFKGGLLSASIDSKVYLSSLTLQELRDLCKAYDLPVSGTKQYLVLFLMQKGPADEIAILAAENSTFLMTNHGAKIVEDNMGLIAYHKQRSHFGGMIDIETANDLLKANPGKDPVKVFTQAIRDYMKTHR